MLKKMVRFLCIACLFIVPLIVWYNFEFVYAFSSFFLILGLYFYLTNQTNFIGSLLFASAFAVPAITWKYFNFWIALISFIIFMSSFAVYKPYNRYADNDSYDHHLNRMENEQSRLDYMDHMDPSDWDK